MREKRGGSSSPPPSHTTAALPRLLRCRRRGEREVERRELSSSPRRFAFALTTNYCRCARGHGGSHRCQLRRVSDVEPVLAAATGSTNRGEKSSPSSQLPPASFMSAAVTIGSRRHMPRHCRRFRREKMRGEKSRGTGQRSPRGRELPSHLLQAFQYHHHGAARRPSPVRARGGREGAREVATEPPLMRGIEHVRGVRGCAVTVTVTVVPFCHCHH